MESAWWPIVDPKGGHARRATPAEIFRCAQYLAGRPFPHRYLARTLEDVELFVRWCVAPILIPHVMLVFIDRSGEIFRFQLLSVATPPAAILRTVTEIPVPVERIERVWVVSVCPTSSPSEEAFRQALLAEIAREHYTPVGYFSVQADRMPTPVLENAKQTFLYVDDQPNTQRIIAAAQIISARRLERGHVILSDRYLEDQIQMCAPPLNDPALEMFFMDDQRHFLHYHKFVGRIADLPPQLKDVLANNGNILARTVQTVVLVVCMKGPLVRLADEQLSVLRRTRSTLAELAISPKCMAVVGIDGLMFYWPSTDGSSSAATAVH